MTAKEYRVGDQRNFKRHAGDGREQIPQQRVTISAVLPKRQWRSPHEPEYVVRLENGATTDALHSELH